MVCLRRLLGVNDGPSVRDGACQFNQVGPVVRIDAVHAGNNVPMHFDLANQLVECIGKVEARGGKGLEFLPVELDNHPANAYGERRQVLHHNVRVMGDEPQPCRPVCWSAERVLMHYRGIIHGVSPCGGCAIRPIALECGVVFDACARARW